MISANFALLGIQTCASLGRHGAVAKGIMVCEKGPFGKGTHTMPYLLVRHKVEDYERWKRVFDHDHGATRERSGSKGGWILRNAEDLNELVILLEWDSLENAQRFANADDLREAMQRAGVADQPDVYFLEEVEQLRA
jgi:heme-degrading monooxygenase HmoA